MEQPTSTRADSRKFKLLLAVIAILSLIVLVLVGLVVYLATRPQTPTSNPGDNGVDVGEPNPNEETPDRSYTIFTKEIKESKTGQYKIEIEYPAIQVEGAQDLLPAAEKFNTEVDKYVNALAKDIRELPREEIAAGDNTISLEYEVKYDANGIISVYLFGYTFTGGAHGATEMRTYLYNITTAKFLDIKDVFKDGEAGLTAVSTYAIGKLKDMESYEEEWLNDGAAAKLENYQIFFIENDKFTVVFPEYQIGPYALGVTKLEIPWSELPETNQDYSQVPPAETL